MREIQINLLNIANSDMFCALERNFSDFLPLQVGQQIPRVGSGGFGSVQFKVGHVGGRQVTTPRCKKYITVQQYY